MSGPLFKYYGAKTRIIKHYPAPRLPLIVEPFAGSASYSLAYRDRDVLLCETDPEVAELWRGLIAAAPSDILSLPVGLPEGLDIRELNIPQWARLLIRYNQRVGMSRCWTVSKWGNLSGFWDVARRARVAAAVPQIRHWQICGESIVDAPIVGAATWFIDPPYEAQASVYGGAAPDFSALGAWCRGLEGQVIVCEAPHPDGRLPAWLPFERLVEARVGPGATGQSHAKRTELIWSRG